MKTAGRHWAPLFLVWLAPTSHLGSIVSSFSPIRELSLSAPLSSPRGKRVYRRRGCSRRAALPAEAAGELRWTSRWAPLPARPCERTEPWHDHPWHFVFTLELQFTFYPYPFLTHKSVQMQPALFFV